MTPLSLYDGHTAVLATMHRKEQALAPVLAARLGLALEVAQGLDTDRFGTFTGEVARAGTMLEAARAKAEAALAASGHSLALASEGSFGPHPSLPYLPAARELLLFIDRARGLEVVETEISLETNYNSLVPASEEELEGFLAAVGFPQHGLVVAPASGGAAVKGITDRAALARAMAEAKSQSADGRVQLSTDMRAHMNPTRMAGLARAAQRLADRLAQRCPACDSPGFGAARPVPGLPCAECGLETAWARGVILSCPRCGHGEAMGRPDGLTAADPAHCPHCNP